MVCRKQFWTLNELANKMKRILVTKLSGSGDLRIGGVFGTTKKKIYLVLTRTIIQCKPNHPTSKTLHKTFKLLNYLRPQDNEHSRKNEQNVLNIFK